MHPFRAICLCVVPALLSGSAFADGPKKPDLTRYKDLWLHSHFTSKKEAPQLPDHHALDDWALGGVSEQNGSHFVVLFHRKEKERVEVITPGVESSFQVISIQRDAQDYKKTQVLLAHEGQQGWVSYDEQLLTLKSSPAKSGEGASNNVTLPTPPVRQPAMRARTLAPTSR